MSNDFLLAPPRRRSLVRSVCRPWRWPLGTWVAIFVIVAITAELIALWFLRPQWFQSEHLIQLLSRRGAS